MLDHAGPEPPRIEARSKFQHRAVVLWLAGTVASALVALLMYSSGVPGWDDAAHAYKVALLRAGESPFWDNFWYGGNYGSITYGFLFYVLGLYVPTKVVAVMAAGAVPSLFYLYQREAWHIEDVWPAWALACTTSVYLAHGQDPFVLALAGTLGGLALLGRDRPMLAAVAVGVSIFANPMGLVVCAPFIASDILARPELRRRYFWFAAGAAPFVAARILLGLVFSEPGGYLAYTSQLLMCLAFALAGLALAAVNADYRRKPFLCLFLAYAAFCVVSFTAAGSQVGNNIGRFVLVFGLPLLLVLRHSRIRRPLLSFLPAVPIVVFGLVQLNEPYGHFTHTDERPQSKAAWFAPALAAARRYSDPAYRIHVVALRRHWEAYYFPEAGFPITRGWYRQADALHNDIFYRHHDAVDYVAWLRKVGAQYVFVADAPPDRWSRQEAGILRASPAFERVERTGAWTVYRLLSPEPLVVGLAGGGATVDEVGHQYVDLTVAAPGSYLLKFSWSPYWVLERGPGDLRRNRDGFIELRAGRAGSYTVLFSVTPAEAVHTLFQRLGASQGPAQE